MRTAGEQGGKFLCTPALTAALFPVKMQHMAKKRTNPTEARLDIRVKPETAETLKKAAKEAGVSMNALMNCISVWAATSLKNGRPVIQHECVVGSEQCDGMFWLGHTTEEEKSQDGEVYAVFDFSTNHAIRDPMDFYREDQI